MIYLCGAGCGDTSLLTMKAKRCLEQAECILYDRLIDPALLEYANQHCEKIYVGKQNHHHVVPQEQIHALLIEKGKQYTCVVRLKGGDPYVFGRGGEEALALYEAGLAFEIVPGIPSPIGGLAYAGIPVTHRGIAGGFRIVSAHNKHDELADIDFESMAKTSDTLIFLMGLSVLARIVQHLILAGKSAETPIALVSSASMKKQRVLVSTLAKIMSEDTSMITSPAMIVVGEVVRLREKLNFFEKRPLYRKRYALPLLHANTGIIEELEEAGAEVVSFICGEMIECEDALSNVILSKYQYIIFTSKSAIDYFFSQIMRLGKDARSLSHLKLCAIGTQTAKHLNTYGLQADIVPQVADSEHLATMLSTVVTKDDYILLPKADNQNDTLFDILHLLCHVDIIRLYETITRPFTLPEQYFDGMLFSCSFMVREVMQIVQSWDAYEQIPMYSIGHRTSESLRAYGITKIIELPQARMSGFIEEILKEEHHV